MGDEMSNAGMAYTVAPLAVLDSEVKAIPMPDVPASIREHAYGVLDTMGEAYGYRSEVWWTVGECGPEFETLVARRVMRDGRLVVQFGKEED